MSILTLNEAYEYKPKTKRKLKSKKKEKNEINSKNLSLRDLKTETNNNFMRCKDFNLTYSYKLKHKLILLYSRVRVLYTDIYFKYRIHIITNIFKCKEYLRYDY